jgi:hypothetical protein
LGINLQYRLTPDGDQSVIGGIYCRYGDAYFPMIGFVYKNIRLMFTYDVTASSLANYNNGNGAWEFALINYGYYSDFSGDRRQFLCPDFKQ